MNREITAQSFREDKIKEYETRREWVTKNFDTFWELAKEAQATGEAFRIETFYGDWQFYPTLKHKLGE